MVDGCKVDRKRIGNKGGCKRICMQREKSYEKAPEEVLMYCMTDFLLHTHDVTTRSTATARTAEIDMSGH